MIIDAAGVPAVWDVDVGPEGVLIVVLPVVVVVVVTVAVMLLMMLMMENSKSGEGFWMKPINRNRNG